MLLIILFKQHANCQSNNYECGFNPQPQEIMAAEQVEAEIQVFKSKFLAADKPDYRSSMELPIQMHIFRNNDGTGGADSLQMVRSIDTLNKYFFVKNDNTVR